MGWKSKILLVLIVYISGFLSAIYYVAPGDGIFPANDKATRIVNGISYYKERASEKMQQINKEDFKNAYDKSLAAIEDMKSKHSSSQQQEEPQYESQ